MRHSNRGGERAVSHSQSSSVVAVGWYPRECRACSLARVCGVHPATGVLDRVGCLLEPTGERQVDPWCSMLPGVGGLR
jgi:hypothetical protein